MRPITGKRGAELWAGYCTTRLTVVACESEPAVAVTVIVYVTGALEVVELPGSRSLRPLHRKRR
jgi:hypothetical protein